jgi:hypothetical protein
VGRASVGAGLQLVADVGGSPRRDDVARVRRGRNVTDESIRRPGLSAPAPRAQGTPITRAARGRPLLECVVSDTGVAVRWLTPTCASGQAGAPDGVGRGSGGVGRCVVRRAHEVSRHAGSSLCVSSSPSLLRMCLELLQAEARTLESPPEGFGRHPQASHVHVLIAGEERIHR